VVTATRARAPFRPTCSWQGQEVSLTAPVCCYSNTTQTRACGGGQHGSTPTNFNPARRNKTRSENREREREIQRTCVRADDMGALNPTETSEMKDALGKLNAHWTISVLPSCYIALKYEFHCRLDCLGFFHTNLLPMCSSTLHLHVTPCSLVETYRRLCSLLSLFWRWRQYLHPKR
jgi:hypothetical protein